MEFARKESVVRKLVEQVNGLQGETFEDFNCQLNKIEATTADVCLKFSRMFVPEVLESILDSSENYEKRLSTLGLALIIGNWTKAPPSQLKRFSDTIIKKICLLSRNSGKNQVRADKAAGMHKT